MNQAPSDITGARHISTLRNTSYRERDQGNYQYGVKNIDESRVVEKVSTYNRNQQNTEERSFGGVHKDKTEMEYNRTQRTEQPVETRVSHYRDGNAEVTRTETTTGWTETQNKTTTYPTKYSTQGYTSQTRTTTNYAPQVKTSQWTETKNTTYPTRVSNSGWKETTSKTYTTEKP